MKAAFVLTLALGLAAAFASADPAAAGGRKGVTNKHAYKTGRTYERRRARRARTTKPQVRGFRLRVGGYSFDVQDTFSVNADAPQPSDFGGRYEDTSPSLNGIIPTNPY